MQQYYVYILTTVNNNVMYVGVTNDLKRRISQHKSGAFDGFTNKYNVKKLVYYEVFSEVKSAIEREKQIKGFSHDKKTAIITENNPYWDGILL